MTGARSDAGDGTEPAPDGGEPSAAGAGTTAGGEDATAVEEGTDTDGGEATVLVLEDERELADTYARWLGEEYDVRVAYTGEEALETAGEVDLDVALLDRRLPGISGDEVLERLRERDREFRVAMLTAVDTDYDIIGMPFDDYVTKPVLREDLLELVDRLRKLDEYDRLVGESYQLNRTIEALEEEKPAAELRDNEEYRDLRERHREVRARIDDIAAEISDERLFRLLGERE